MDPVATLPEANAEAEVTPRHRGVAVSTRIERVHSGTLVVRPSVGEYVDQQVVRVGDAVQVFWRDAGSGWALPAEVATVQRGAVPRWHLDVVGPAEALQRREAVRTRLTLSLTAVVNGVDLEGEVLDLSEGGVRAVMEAFGYLPSPGSIVPLTVHLEDGDLTAPAEVVRHRELATRWGLSLRFLGLTDKEQDRLRRRVFRAMREERARRSD